MTTATWSSRVRQSDNATYQEWRDEFITKLGVMVTAGKLAADETNITPGAGAIPANNTEQGYAVYHLADSLHGTAPVYIRFGFGAGGASTIPRIQATVGTSTNGSGVLGGTALSSIATMNLGAVQTTDTARTSYMCCVAGCFWVNWKQGAGAGAEGWFFFCRTCDNTGAPTATGGYAYWGSGGASPTKTQAYRYAATAASYTAQTNSGNNWLGFMPQSLASSLVGSDIQVAMAWTVAPAVTPLFGICGVLNAEVGNGVSFSVALVGASARTYLALSTTGTNFNNSQANALMCAPIYE